jgi:hypothetical protein
MSLFTILSTLKNDNVLYTPVELDCDIVYVNTMRLTGGVARSVDVGSVVSYSV